MSLRSNSVGDDQLVFRAECKMAEAFIIDLANTVLIKDSPSYPALRACFCIEIPKEESGVLPMAEFRDA